MLIAVLHEPITVAQLPNPISIALRLGVSYWYRTDGLYDEIGKGLCIWTQQRGIAFYDKFVCTSTHLLLMAIWRSSVQAIASPHSM